MHYLEATEIKTSSNLTNLKITSGSFQTIKSSLAMMSSLDIFPYQISSLILSSAHSFLRLPAHSGPNYYLDTISLSYDPSADILMQHLPLWPNCPSFSLTLVFTSILLLDAGLNMCQKTVSRTIINQWQSQSIIPTIHLKRASPKMFFSLIYSFLEASFSLS